MNSLIIVIVKKSNSVIFPKSLNFRKPLEFHTNINFVNPLQYIYTQTTNAFNDAHAFKALS